MAWRVQISVYRSLCSAWRIKVALIPQWEPSFAGWPGPANRCGHSCRARKGQIISETVPEVKNASDRTVADSLQGPDAIQQLFEAFELSALGVGGGQALGFGLEL